MPPKQRKPGPKGAKAPPKRARKVAKVEDTVSEEDSLFQSTRSDAVSDGELSVVTLSSDTVAGEGSCEHRGQHPATKRGRVAGSGRATAKGKRARSAVSVTEVMSGDEGSDGEDGTQASTPRGQRTLDGRVLPEADGKATSAIGGELKPGKVEKPASRAKTPADPKEFFLKHLPSALALESLACASKEITLTDTMGHSWDGVDENAEENNPHQGQHEAPQDSAPGAFFGLPCLHVFMLRECIRATEEAHEWNEDPLAAALRVFGFLISMCEESLGSLSALLYICCPAARSRGISTETTKHVLSFLVETRRMEPSEVLSTDPTALQAFVLEQLPGFVKGWRSRHGQAAPIEPEHCCACGNTHFFLSNVLSMCVALKEMNGRRLAQVQAHYFPWPALEVAASAARRVYALVSGTREKYEAMSHSALEKALRNGYAPAHVRGNRPVRRTKKKATIAEPNLTPFLCEVNRNVFRDTLASVRARERTSARAPPCVTEEYYQDIAVAWNYGLAHSTGYVEVIVNFPRGQVRSCVLWRSFLPSAVMGEQLWMLFSLNNHATREAAKNADGRAVADKGVRCECHTASTGSLSTDAVRFLECHGEVLTAMQTAKEAEHILPNQDVGRTHAVDVDADESVGGVRTQEDVKRQAACYSRASFDRHRFLCGVTDSLTLQQLVDCAAVESVAGMSADASAVPRDLIKADLKRHQLEDVQWMSEREESGSPEYAELPLYTLDASTGSAVVKGSYFYCGATNGFGYVAHDTGRHTLLLSSLRRPVRGGFLGDDVGLGKTLVLLTLCAKDAALHKQMHMEEEAVAVPLSVRGVRGGTGKETKSGSRTGDTDGMRLSPPSLPLEVTPGINVWRVGSVRGPGSLNAPSDIDSLLRDAFGFCKLRATTAVRLPRTTLVVVPLSIAGQWISEVEKFYPSATYVLFYGAKRHRYTVEDMAKADFVITTYETVAVHLRKERDGGSQLIAEKVASEMDMAAYSSWPKSCDFLDFEHTGVFEKGLVHPEAVSVSEMADRGSTTPRQQGARGKEAMWHMRDSPREAEEAAQGVPTFDRVVFEGPRYHIFVFKVPYRNPMSTKDKTTQVFLDSVWDIVSAWARRFLASSPNSAMPRLSFLPLDCLNDLIGHPFANVETRRQFVLHAVLPFFAEVLTSFWKMLHEQLDPQTGKAKGLRITDLLFRRVIFDECQKCGPNSFFHLLQGERRWAVSGTPINNNNPSTLAEPLRIIGAHNARQAISDGSTGGTWIPSALVGRHFSDSSYRVYDLNTSRKAVLFKYWAYRNRDAPIPDFVELNCAGNFCLCPMCSSSGCYGYPVADSMGSLARMQYPARMSIFSFGPNGHRGLCIVPSMLLLVLVRFVVRHERTAAVREDLRLQPVEHVSVSVHLLDDELFFYARYATLVSAVSARLHREGRLTHRMSAALQWIQTLCRLALHPKTAAANALQALAGPDLLAEPLPLDDAERIAAVANSFIVLTAAAVLEWAREQVACPRMREGRLVTVPAETLETLEKLAGRPPEFPVCGICLDQMSEPTVLMCYHMFCKECLMGVIQSGLSTATGNSNARCPYCRDKGSMNDVKRIAKPEEAEDEEAKQELQKEEILQSQTPTKNTTSGDQLDNDEEVSDEERLARIGTGSRAAALLRLLATIWDAAPGDGVLVFSKFPGALQHVHDAVAQEGYQPLLMDGSTSLARRRKITSTLQQPIDAQPSDVSNRADRRILFVSSRAANAGLNLTFANHIIFLEPNVNPAVEVQAIGRVHRFGQVKPVKAYHLFAPGTVEELLYRRSARILEQLQHTTDQHHAQLAGVNLEGLADLEGAAVDPAAVARREQLARLGRVEPTETVLLLQYPPVLQP